MLPAIGQDSYIPGTLWGAAELSSKGVNSRANEEDPLVNLEDGRL